jgi:hypothetical protein
MFMKRSLILPLLLFGATALSGCEIAGDIFQAGVWVGVLLVIGVVALVVWLISRAVG